MVEIGYVSIHSRLFFCYKLKSDDNRLMLYEPEENLVGNQSDISSVCGKHMIAFGLKVATEDEDFVVTMSHMLHKMDNETTARFPISELEDGCFLMRFGISNRTNQHVLMRTDRSKILGDNISKKYTDIRVSNYGAKAKMARIMSKTTGKHCNITASFVSSS